MPPEAGDNGLRQAPAGFPQEAREESPQGLDERSDIVLAFDTSAAHCAAALLRGDRIVAARHEAMATGQAERLVPLLEDLLTEAGLGWRDVTRIGVGTGPGNFTGLRIAVAAARGLALGLGVPALGVTRLEALAHGLPRPLAVVEDARRGAIYCQETGGPARLSTVEGCGLGPVDLVGSAAEAVAAVTGGAVLAPAMPLCEAIARLAAAQAPGARPAPFYLRGADAAPPADPPPVILPDPVAS